MKFFSPLNPRFFIQGRRAGFSRLFLALFLLIPSMVLIAIVFKDYKKISTESLFRMKASQAQLAATIVEEKLNSLVALTTSYATRPLVIMHIQKNRWDSAMTIFSEVLRDNHGFERLVLFDTCAMIRADLPHANVIGQSRADMEWFKSFKKTWRPYVSGIYQRGAKPKMNVICIVVPIVAQNILSNDTGFLNHTAYRRIGIMQLQVNLELFHSWARINIGPEGIIYIVDQNGKIVHHPRYENHDTIIDFSSVGIVKKIIAGGTGVERNYNEVEKEERIAAFRTIPDYHWGVVVTQPVAEAFKERDVTLGILTVSCCLLLVLAFALFLAINHALVNNQKASEKLSRKNAELAEVNGDLKMAIQKIKILKGLLPICSYCKKIRDDSGYWQQIETYVSTHSDADFSHGICPSCMEKYYPLIFKKEERSAGKVD